MEKQDLKSAVALNSLGINIARAIGPAMGGLILASLGAAFTYGVDVISYAFVIAALLWWKRPKAAQDVLAERFPGAFRAGLRYARASRELHVVLLRAFVFFALASSVWALLPLVARGLLGGGAGFYGILLGAVGLGGDRRQLPTSEHRSMYSYVRLSIIDVSYVRLSIDEYTIDVQLRTSEHHRCQLRTSEHRRVHTRCLYAVSARSCHTAASESHVL